VNRRGTMNKLKMLVLTALVAATVGFGALASAPSASAMPVDCDALVMRALMYQSLAYAAEGMGNLDAAMSYFNRSTLYFRMATVCEAG
jgi:hypothetical protein